MTDWADTQLLAPFFVSLSSVAAEDSATLLWMVARVCRSWRHEADVLRANQEELLSPGSSACLQALARWCPHLRRLTLVECSASDRELLSLTESCPMERLELRKPSTGEPFTHPTERSFRRVARRLEGLRMQLETLRPGIELELPRVSLRVDIRVDGLAPRVERVKFECVHDHPLRRLMYACCERAGEPMPSMAFRYHGKRINKYQTPLQLDMNDNDVIDAFGVHLLTPSPM